MNELKKFVNSSRFKPYFENYAKEFIVSQQELVADQDRFRRRESVLETIKRRMIAEKSNNNDRYSNSYPDKLDWDQIDYLIRILYLIKKINLNSL